MKRHIICERDVGLFSLIQQVVANIPWALCCGRTPIVLFQAGTCYWTPNGYRGSDTVWEYYFEPVVPTEPAAAIPHGIRHAIALRPPHQDDIGYFVDGETFVTNHFGDHPDLAGMALSIPYALDDPDAALRDEAAAVIGRYLRPRPYLLQQVERLRRELFGSRYVIGVHARGTDALASANHTHRHGSLVLEEYVAVLGELLQENRDARVFVATDAESTLASLEEAFGDRVVACDSLRHNDGNPVGWGPTGGVMPAYIARDRERAAQNGYEALVEYLLLTRCDWLVHNGASLARTVLLAEPTMEHTNTHLRALAAQEALGRS